MSFYKQLMASITPRGIIYHGPRSFYRNHKQPWECAQGHQWQAPPATIINGSGCPTCWQNRHRLDRNGELHKRLAALNIGLVGDWNGAKKKNTFLCLSCNCTWEAFGLTVTNQGSKCPVCDPSKKRKAAVLKIKMPSAPTPAKEYA